MGVPFKKNEAELQMATKAALKIKVNVSVGKPHIHFYLVLFSFQYLSKLSVHACEVKWRYGRTPI